MIVLTIFWHILHRQELEKMVMFLQTFSFSKQSHFSSVSFSVWACSSNEKSCFFRQLVLSCWMRTVPWSSVPSDWINVLLFYMLKGHLEKWVRAGHSQEIYYRIFPLGLHWTIRSMGEYAEQRSSSLTTRLKIRATQSLANRKDPTLLSMKTRLCDETLIRLLSDLTISSFRKTTKWDFHLHPEN